MSTSRASFYYKSTSIGTPTLTAAATNYQPASTTFNIITATEQTSIFSSAFDGSNWQDGWSFWGNPPWAYTTTTFLSAPRSVYSYTDADGSNQGPFSSNRMPSAENALYISVTFDFKLQSTEVNDFQLRYSGDRTDTFGAVHWSTAANNLGDRTAYAYEWNQVTINIYDAEAFTDYFRIQFLSQGLTSGEAVYVDNVQVTMYY